MTEKRADESGLPGKGLDPETISWKEQVGLSAKTPIGLFGITLTTVCIILTLLGILVHALGLVKSPYAAIVTVAVFPAGALFGLLLIPVSSYFRRKKWFGKSFNKANLVIDFNKQDHRKTMIIVLVLTIVNAAVFSLVAYEAYHFIESDAFCGTVCHTVMAPEYTAYQRSPHAEVGCVSCHIGSGAKWFVKAKISGLRQVKGVLTGDYSRPIPTPVEHMRPAEDTCQQCHWSEKFHGKKAKTFVSYKNDSQEKANVQEITLNVGGKNPLTGNYEGIHSHVNKDRKIEYEMLNDKRTSIGQVKVTKASGETETYSIDGKAGEVGKAKWRTMDCIDCHNRPTHIYEELEEKVDFGLQSKKLNPTIAGIREDSLAVLKKEYTTRDEAKKQIVETLLAFQTKRHGAEFVAKNGEALKAAGGYLQDAYLANIWPAMKITWGSYKKHTGHQNEGDGFGCYRCHDDQHQTEDGKTISQGCDLCHAEP